MHRAIRAFAANNPSARMALDHARRATRKASIKRRADLPRAGGIGNNTRQRITMEVEAPLPGSGIARIKISAPAVFTQRGSVAHEKPALTAHIDNPHHLCAEALFLTIRPLGHAGSIEGNSDRLVQGRGWYAARGKSRCRT